MKEIINLKHVDYTKEPLFFGKDLSIQRYDIFKYKKFFDIYQQQMSFFWRPEEINVSLDGGQFKGLSENEKWIFTQNLKYQILLDSVQSRAIPFIVERTSNPEFEAAAKAWEFFETIHSYSYTYIIKNIYSNPSEVFDNIINDKEIVKRATSVTEYYNKLIENVPDESLYDKKKKLYLTLISVNILEGIRFYVSFACSYSFAERGTMEGNAKIISLINRDENIHLAITQNLLNLFRTEKDEGFQKVVKDCEKTVIEMYQKAAEEEMEWARYLFKDGSILGLNEEILIKYMQWLTNKRMKAIGLEGLFPTESNPINWIKNWTESKNVQVAPQETEIESYKVGSFTHDIHNVNFDKFDF
ncbi:MAG: ribonucleotide-diphosphate reductase subunit beta [Fibrobacterales bacterium]